MALEERCGAFMSFFLFLHSCKLRLLLLIFIARLSNSCYPRSLHPAARWWLGTQVSSPTTQTDTQTGAGLFLRGGRVAGGLSWGTPGPQKATHRLLPSELPAVWGTFSSAGPGAARPALPSATAGARRWPHGGKAGRGRKLRGRGREGPPGAMSGAGPASLNRSGSAPPPGDRKREALGAGSPIQPIIKGKERGRPAFGTGCLRLAEPAVCGAGAVAVRGGEREPSLQPLCGPAKRSEVRSQAAPGGLSWLLGPWGLKVGAAAWPGLGKLSLGPGPCRWREASPAFCLVAPSARGR